MVILRESKSQLINNHERTEPLQILALCWVLIRFIATVIRVSDIRVMIYILRLRQPRVRVKFRLRVNCLVFLFCMTKSVNARRSKFYVAQGVKAKETCRKSANKMLFCKFIIPFYLTVLLEIQKFTCESCSTELPDTL